MHVRKANLLKLSDSERTRILSEARSNLWRQVLEARLCRDFDYLYDCNFS